VEALEDRFLPTTSTSAVISGHVFYDVNNTGLMAPGDSPVANSTIQLHTTKNGQDVVIGTTTTDGNGYYQFNQDATVSPAAQTITKTLTIPSTLTNFSLGGTIPQFDTTPGILQSVQITNAGSITSTIAVENTSTSSPSTINAVVAGKLLLTGPGGVNVETDVDQNAGNFDATTFDNQLDFAGTSGKTFAPQTANGTQTVTLTGAAMAPFEGTGSVQFTENGVATSTATGGGNLVASITSSGQATVTVTYTYILDNSLQPGNYTVQQVGAPPGYVPGLVSSGGIVLSNPPTDRVIPITITGPNINSPNNDFAELKASSLSGYVYADVGAGGYNDGIKEPGEPGVAGVTITLDGTDSTGPVHRVVQTDANGFYDFTQLRQGTYSITETDPPGYLDGKDTIGTPGGTTVKNQFTSINLPGGYDGTNNNFAVLQTSSLGGTVYLDVSPTGFNNGVRDASEAGIPGVTLTLTGVDAASNPVTLVTVTDAAGNYLFPNLAPGTYNVTETPPPNLLDGKDTIGDHGGTVGKDVLSNIVLGAGAQARYYNFAALIPSTLSGYVYSDSSPGGFNNGSKDAGEPGIAGSVITLSGFNDLGPVSQTMTTDGNGFYSFTGLRPGYYQLTQDDPAGFTDGKDTIGVQGGLTGKDTFYAIGLPPGVNGYNNNFGELPPVISSTPPGVNPPATPPGTPQLPPVLSHDSNPSTPSPVPVLSKAQLVAGPSGVADPTVVADARFINTVYHAILNRDVETAALNNWLVFLRTGGTRQQFVAQVWNSDENHIRQVVALYNTILQTDPPANLLNWYVGQMRLGATEIQVAASIAGSAQGGALYPTSTAYINELYQLVDGRNATAAEQANWAPLASDRQTLAIDVLMSTDSLSNIVATTYQALLGRPADANEIAFRVSQLQNGWTFGNLVQDILNSTEFKNLVMA
jgi:hypothetical protein